GPFARDGDGARQEMCHRLGDGERRGEAKLRRRGRGAGGAQHERAIEIARRRNPSPAAPAAAGALLARQDERALAGAAFGEAHGLVVGAVDPLEVPQTEERRETGREAHPAKRAADTASAPSTTKPG